MQSLFLFLFQRVKEGIFLSFFLSFFLEQTFEEAVEWNNEVHQGLSSSLFTQNPEYLFKWIGPQGSDCGLVSLSLSLSFSLAERLIVGECEHSDQWC